MWWTGDVIFLLLIVFIGIIQKAIVRLPLIIASGKHGKLTAAHVKNYFQIAFEHIKLT